MYKLSFAVIILCLLASCGGDTTKIDTQAYEEQKQNLTNQEKSRPLAFLRVQSEDKKNWLGKTVVRGTVTSTATVCSYKNVRLKMLCYDADKKMIEEHEDVLDDAIKPNSKQAFTLRYRLPRGTDSIALSIMSAAAEGKKSK